ncbi:MAG: hypothetical protein J4F48_12245 [Nitrospinae bacterium]|nr:hypothetical protein [Nitrospinota bacterium]
MIKILLQRSFRSLDPASPEGYHASQRYAGQEAPHGTVQDRSGFAGTGSLSRTGSGGKFSHKKTKKAQRGINSEYEPGQLQHHPE